MNKITVSIVATALLSLFAIGQIHAMGKREDTVIISKDKAPIISVATAYKLWEGKKAVFIDALPADYYTKRHIPGALNISARDPESGMHFLKDLPKDTILVSYCYNPQCPAGEQTAEYLISEGYTQVYDFKGGITTWQKAGLPVEK